MDRAERSSESSMEELVALVETAGGEVIVALIQNRPSPDPRSFIGDGKVAEMKALIALNDCDLAVFDNELSPSQMRGLSEDLGIRVLDRSGLILDEGGAAAGGAGAVPVSASPADRYVDPPGASDRLRRQFAHRDPRSR